MGKATKKRDAKGRFAAGNGGKPKGAKSRATRLGEDLIARLEQEGPALLDSAIDRAKAGCPHAQRLLLGRILPKQRRVILDVPEIASAADVPAALSAIMAATARGEIAPEEAAALASIVESTRRAYELADIETRLSALEGSQHE